MRLLKREAIKAISSLWIATLAGAGLAFVTQAILARSLLPESYGVLSSSLSFVMLFVPLAGFGVAQFWLKAFGQEGWEARKWLQGSLRFIICSTSLVFLSLLGWAFLGPHNLLTNFVLCLLSFHIFAQVILDLVSSRLQMEERFLSLSAWQLLPHLMRFLLVCSITLFLNDSISAVLGASIYALVAIVMIPIGYFMLKPMFNYNFRLVGHDLPTEKWNKGHKSAYSVILLSWPFGLAAFAHLIYYQSDIVLLKYLDNDVSAGIYNIAFLIISAIYLLPNVIFQKYFLPKLHRWSVQEPERVKEVFLQGNLFMLLLGIAFLGGIWLTGDWVVFLLFGEPYKESANILKILSFSVPFMFVAFSAGAVLVTQNHMKIKVKLMLAVAMLNVILNILLIPIYGTLGAAVSTIISNFTLAALYYASAHYFVIKK